MNGGEQIAQVLKQQEAEREEKIHGFMQVKTDSINPLHLCVRKLMMRFHLTAL
jgi:hypothetical protein